MQMLLLCKHSHHDERVKINAFTEHPEIIATQHVHVEKVQHLTANLQGTRSVAEAERIVDLPFCLYLSSIKINQMRTLLTSSQQEIRKDLSGCFYTYTTKS